MLYSDFNLRGNLLVLFSKTLSGFSLFPPEPLINFLTQTELNPLEIDILCNNRPFQFHEAKNWLLLANSTKESNTVKRSDPVHQEINLLC